MAVLDRLERRFGKLAIPRITWPIVVGQGLAYLAARADPRVYEAIVLVPQRVVDGEVWRLLTFVFTPPPGNFFFALLGLYVFLLMGNALEDTWGAFRYNVYLGVAYVASVLSAFAFPELIATNVYFESTVFLAFAYLFPNFELLLFFVLPVKVKWLALLTWLFYGFQFVRGSWSLRLSITAAVLNFLLFFGADIVRSLRQGKRRMDHKARFVSSSFAPEDKEDGVYHRCAECGLTNKDDPAMDFRYCDECAGHHGYCRAHLRSHTHRTADAAASSSS